MASLLTGLIALGAVGLFLALPSGRQVINRVGLVLLAAALGVLLAAAIELFDNHGGWSVFAICAAVGLFGAVRVITHPKPVYSALYFVLLVVAVTGLLVLMQAEFLAAALVIIYAGAILVTYVFVIMLAQQSRPAVYDTHAREPFWGVLAGFALLTALAGNFELFQADDDRSLTTVLTRDAAGTVEAVGVPLLTEYVIAVQLAGLLLLAAMVGAIAIARRRQEPTFERGGDE